MSNPNVETENEPSIAETSGTSENTTDKKEESNNDDQLIDPFIDFECDVCHVREKCLFGDLNISDGFYNSPVYFIRDPFKPPARVRTKKPTLDDFLVLGAPCSLCNRPVCFDKSCSVFFGSNFCALCVARERRRFPDKVLEMLSKGVVASINDQSHK